MISLYRIVFYQPLLNLLVVFGNTIAFGDLGVAIILLTILVRLLLYPVFERSIRHQFAMQKIQPHLKKVQEDHRNNKEKQLQATMALYREHGVNPLSPFLLMLIQLPVLIALYQIFLEIVTPAFVKDLYAFVPVPTDLRQSLFGLINLAEPSILVVGLAALAQYFQARLALPKTQKGQTPTAQDRMVRRMVYLGPLLTIFIFARFPAAIGLYWLTSSAFSVLQQVIANKKFYHGNI